MATFRRSVGLSPHRDARRRSCPSGRSRRHGSRSPSCRRAAASRDPTVLGLEEVSVALDFVGSQIGEEKLFAAQVLVFFGGWNIHCLRGRQQCLLDDAEPSISPLRHYELLIDIYNISTVTLWTYPITHYIYIYLCHSFLPSTIVWTNSNVELHIRLSAHLRSLTR